MFMSMLIYLVGDKQESNVCLALVLTPGCSQEPSFWLSVSQGEATAIW